MPYNYVLTLFMKHPFILGQRTPYSITKVGIKVMKFVESLIGWEVARNSHRTIHMMFI